MRTLGVRRLAANESGTTAIEYALIASLISIGIFAALNTIAGSLTGTLQTVAAAL